MLSVTAKAKAKEKKKAAARAVSVSEEAMETVIIIAAFTKLVFGSSQSHICICLCYSLRMRRASHPLLLSRQTLLSPQLPSLKIQPKIARLRIRKLGKLLRMRWEVRARRKKLSPSQTFRCSPIQPGSFHSR